jgi:hypothetical protein
MIVAKWALFQDYKVGLASENQLMKWFVWMNEEQIHVLNSADAEIALDKWLIHSEVKKNSTDRNSRELLTEWQAITENPR